MANYKKQKCIYCLEYHEELTRDHIFPKSWYPDSTPEEIERWTVPACSKCNKKLGIAEEKIFNRLVICLDENELGASGLNERVIKWLSKPLQEEINKREEGRRVKFLMDTIKDFSPDLYEKRDGRVLKGMTPKEGVRSRRMIRIPNNELTKVTEKMVRGLEYKVRERLIDLDRKVDIITPKENKEDDKLIKKWNKLIKKDEGRVDCGPGFAVRYRSNPIDDNWVIYHIKLMGHYDVWGFVYPKNKKTERNKQKYRG
jgi:hypothetical protein